MYRSAPGKSRVRSRKDGSCLYPAFPKAAPVSFCFFCAVPVCVCRSTFLSTFIDPPNCDTIIVTEKRLKLHTAARLLKSQNNYSAQKIICNFVLICFTEAKKKNHGIFRPFRRLRGGAMPNGQQSGRKRFSAEISDACATPRRAFIIFH